jgi:antitoxin MazE
MARGQARVAVVSANVYPLKDILMIGDRLMLVAKWGNSLAVRLPKALVERLNLKAGDEINITDADAERLVVAKADEATAALERMAKRGWAAPHDFRFDRDEANRR